MPNHLIFEGDAKDDCKDIDFSAVDTCLVLPVVHLPFDPAVMPSCANLFQLCHRCFQDAWPHNRPDTLD